MNYYQQNHRNNINYHPEICRIAKEITFDAGFPTWTDPRTGVTHRNPRTQPRKNKHGRTKTNKTR
jgi:hypothetical protein